LDCFTINNLLKNNNIFSFHQRIVFRTTTFLYKIIPNNNAPLELKSFLKAQVIKDNKYNLRSNSRTLVVPLRFKNSFLSNIDLYVKNFLRLTPKYNLNLDYYFYK
jgi:hypothetical protein